MTPGLTQFSAQRGLGGPDVVFSDAIRRALVSVARLRAAVASQFR